MLIKELRIKNFGKFEEKTLPLDPGINIIYGENEAGKSTIHGFIRGMFFGITKARGRATKEDMYMKYLPWSNPSLYQGSMDIEVDNKTYRIYRNFHKDYRDYRIIDLETGREIGLEQGEGIPFLPGLLESNYRNTISIEQLKAKTEKELVTEVQNHITNLTTSKNSEVSVSEATQSLKAKKKEIEGKNTKEKYRKLKEQLNDYEIDEKRLKSSIDRLKNIENRQKHFHQLMKEKRHLEDNLSLVEIKLSEDYQYNYIRLEDDLKEYENLLKRENGALDQSKENSDRSNEKDTNREGVYNPKRDLGLYKKLLIPILGTVIIILTNSFHKLWIPFSILIWIGYLGSNFLLKRHTKGSEEATEKIQDKNLWVGANNFLDDITKRKEKILELNRVRTYEELVELAEDVKKKKEYRISLQEEKKRIQEYLSKKNEELATMADHIMKEYEQIESDQTNHVEYGNIQDKLNYAMQCDMLFCEKLKWNIDQLEERQVATYEGRRKLEELQEVIRWEEEELVALDLSISTIEKLSMEIHDTFGLSISHEVSDIISRLTNHRYEDIKVDEKLGIKVLYKDDYIPLEKLSVGTTHQVYLALRMAVAKMIYQGQDMPLLLDDCFAYYDDVRLKQVLLELAYHSSSQIIIFTCHKREKEILDQLGIKYHFISL